MYATNSGGTEMAAQTIASLSSHTVDMKRAIETNPDELATTLF
jgi:hypothetical protein